nr:MAG TPA: hypothetical protein [Caudoviricetes sp.]
MGVAPELSHVTGATPKQGGAQLDTTCCVAIHLGYREGPDDLPQRRQ